MTKKLFKKIKGEILVKEISRGMYSDSDGYQEALDFWMAEGWHETYEEAKE